MGEPSLEMKQNNSYQDILNKSSLEFQHKEENKENNIITLITCNSNSEKRIVVNALENSL